MTRTEEQNREAAQRLEGRSEAAGMFAAVAGFGGYVAGFVLMGLGQFNAAGLLFTITTVLAIIAGCAAVIYSDRASRHADAARKQRAADFDNSLYGWGALVEAAERVAQAKANAAATRDDFSSAPQFII